MKMYPQHGVSDHSTEFGVERLRYGHGSLSHLLCDSGRSWNQVVERDFRRPFKS